MGLKYLGKKTWTSQNKVTVVYTGYWMDNRFHGSVTLQFTWKDKFDKDRADHRTVLKVRGEFFSGDAVGSVTIEYSPQNQKIDKDIRVYEGPCLVEEDDGSDTFWKVYKN